MKDFEEPLPRTILALGYSLAQNVTKIEKKGGAGNRLERNK